MRFALALAVVALVAAPAATAAPPPDPIEPVQVQYASEAPVAAQAPVPAPVGAAAGVQVPEATERAVEGLPAPFPGHYGGALLGTATQTHPMPPPRAGAAKTVLRVNYPTASPVADVPYTLRR